MTTAANDQASAELMLFWQRLLFTVVAALIWTVLIPLMFQHGKRYRQLLGGGIPFLGSQPEGWSWPFLGQALNYLKYRPWDLMMKWHRVHGPIFAFELFGSLFVSVSSPLLLKQVLQSKISAVKKDVANTMKHFLVILGTGIVTSEDDSWMKQRLKMSMPLRRDVLEWIPAQTARAIHRLCQQTLDPACQDPTAVVPVGSCLRHLTLQVISATFLSLTAEESDSTFAGLYLPIVDESNKRVWHPYRAYLFVLPQFWMHLWNVRCLNSYVSSLIRKRWKERQATKQQQKQSNQQDGDSSSNRDILDLVLQVYETEFPESSILPEAAVMQFRDEMKTFMLAGHETSAAMMTWTLYELMGNEKLRQEVIDEAQSVFKTNSRNSNNDYLLEEAWDAEQLSNLTLSEACLKESLRKYSVVPIVARRTVQDLFLHGDDDDEKDHGGKKYFIPKGCSVMINIQSIHMDPTLWPNPQKFDPYRFMLSGNEETSDYNGEAARMKQPDPFTFVPFIAGPRNCLGQHLSLLESKMVISLLLKQYKFSLPKGVKLQVNDWKFGDDDSDPRHRFIIPVIPKQELLVHVAKR